MRKNFNILLVFVICLISSTVLFAQQRNVIWLHGNGDNRNVWENNILNIPNSLNDQYQILSESILSYPSGPGVNNYANNVRLNNFHLQGVNTMIIGHSMGGVVGRDLLMPGTANNFQGGPLISIGSPLTGARVANSVLNGDVNTLIQKGINELTAGPAITIIPGISIYFSVLFNVNIVANNIKDFVFGKVIDYLFLRNQQGRQATTDLSVNSAYMNSSRTWQTTNPHLAIFGVTPSPVVYNIVGSIREEEGNGTRQEFLQEINNLTNVYRATYNYYLTSSVILPIRLYWALQWKRGKDFLEYGLEDEWHKVIGATASGSIVNTYCEEVMVCDWDTYYMQCSGAGGWDPIDPGFGCCMGQVCFSTVVQSNTESDAFIPAISQRGDLLQTRPTRLQRVENVDHRSMTFSNAVLEALERAFNGQNGLEFRIERR